MVTVPIPRHWQQLLLCYVPSSLFNPVSFTLAFPLATGLSNCVFERHRGGIPLENDLSVISHRHCQP